MWISRVRVTGGFLSGLDLTFEEGLNVVIGSRGTGKTTLLELLRHALGAMHADESDSKARQEFISAVLGAGEVIVDVETEDGGRHLVVDSKGGGQRSDLSRSVLVLGQNELEEIASDARSRLNLLDLRMGFVATNPSLVEAAELTGKIADIRASLDELREETKSRMRLIADRELFASQESALLSSNSSEVTVRREELRVAEESVIESSHDLDVIGSIHDELDVVLSEQYRQTTEIEDLVERVSSVANLGDARAELVEALGFSGQLIEMLGQVKEKLVESADNARSRNLEARTLAAPIRDVLEKAETGLGQITAQIRNIDAELRTLDERDAEIANLESRFTEFEILRSRIFDNAERVEEAQFKSRSEVARSTTAQISNNIVVVVDHLANSDDFRTFLQKSLYGTKTRTTTIDAVADHVLPRQLLEIIESHNASGLSALTDMANDKTQKLIENLDRKEILKELAQIRLADSVDFRLEDGAIEKSVDLLSTGQKCAVTLPIVLSEQERTLIIDQPEDHLDNAYLVKNVVASLVVRGQNGAQTIVATHNANIPVLGSADRVIVLTSDGKNGRVNASGPFDEDEIVETITGLMEGGREAFARRSAFYEEHGGLA